MQMFNYTHLQTEYNLRMNISFSVIGKIYMCLSFFLRVVSCHLFSFNIFGAFLESVPYL